MQRQKITLHIHEKDKQKINHHSEEVRAESLSKITANTIDSKP